MDKFAQTYAAARANMVDGQVRPNMVSDSRILEAMRSLPREQFLPPKLASLAYSDTNVPLGGGRVMLAPMVIARLVQLARPRRPERALVVGSGTGYGAALLAACGCTVTGVEDEDTMRDAATQLVPGLAPGVRFVKGGLAEGLADQGPWDIVMIEGAVTSIPPALASQLAQGGRLVAILAKNDVSGAAVLGEGSRSGDTPVFKIKEMFNCHAPIIPSLRTAGAFRF